MTVNAREWGITILRIWMGFLIASAGWGEIRGVALGQLVGIWKTPFATMLPSLLLLAGGAAILLGIAVRLAGFSTALLAAFLLWSKGGVRAGSFGDATTMGVAFLVFGVALVLTGPGRLNAGAFFAKRK